MFNIFKKKIIILETDKIFSFLASISHNPDIIENFLFQYNRLKKKYKNDDSIFISLYLSWEDFIVNNKTQSFKNYTTEDLRNKLAKEIDINKVSDSFKLLFLDKRNQSILIYKIFSKKLSDYIISQLGYPVLVKTIREMQDPLMSRIKLTSENISFEFIDKSIQNSFEYSMEDITKSFKNLINVFYNTIEISFGTKLTHDIFNKIFMEFKQRYNAEIVTIILKIIPERILGMDEWLSLMSKKELEKQVIEKTQELSNINLNLEKTIAERTAELQKAYNELKQLDQKKSEFISVAAHQLRTPLSGIKWGLTMLKNEEFGKLNEEQKKFLEKNIDTNEKIISIVNDLLDIDLYTQDKIQYEFKNIDINQIIKNNIDILRNQADQKRITINYNKNTNDKFIVNGDDKKINIAIQNLIDNAIKYSKNNSNIDIELLKINSVIQVSVKNTGIGIPEEEQEQIFQRFFRAKNAIRHQTEGTGVGLFITKNIIEDHQGRIWFTSNKLGETTFFINLPTYQKDISFNSNY